MAVDVGAAEVLCGWCLQPVREVDDRIVSKCSLEGECTGGGPVVCHHECAVAADQGMVTKCGGAMCCPRLSM